MFYFHDVLMHKKLQEEGRSSSAGGPWNMWTSAQDIKNPDAQVVEVCKRVASIAKVCSCAKSLKISEVQIKDHARV